jgi:hypothetical protein
VTASIDMLFDGVQWTARTDPPPADDSIPYATHSGELDLLGMKFRVYQLSDGRRLVDANDVHALLEGLTR